MSTRAASKQGRPTGKSTAKTSGKDQIKGDKQLTSVLEIVPGKFNETDWLSLLENEDTEDFIADLFENIWTETSKQIQQIYIRKQLLPFTLMMTENALSSVIQWAFLERDEPKPASSNFWKEDSEPIPSTMDNWGEGVVPACREEHPQNIEVPHISVTDRPLSAPVHLSRSENIDRTQRPSTGSSITSSSHTSRSNSQTKKLPRINESDNIHQQIKQEQSIKTNSDDRILTQKESSTTQTTSRSSFEQKSYNHDILVIHTQPPKLEPLSDLFYHPRKDANKSFSHATPPTTSTTKRRHTVTPKASSQHGSDTIASTTNMTTITTKSYKKSAESKAPDDQQIEEAISKAPVATHSILKSILSRPSGYRELELDDDGNVISIAKLDLDKTAPKSIRVKCDVLKPRKSMIETRPPPIKLPQQKIPEQSEPKFLSTKFILPDQSTDVGDLIQPVPGVLYEDNRLKKGDPRRYQSGMSKYTTFYDENRPLRPISQRSDLTKLQTANDLLRQSEDYNKDDENEQESQIPKLHKFARIPPILSGSSTTSA